MKTKTFLIVIGAALLMTACANPNPMVGQVADPAGFFSGILHGAIIPIAFLGKIFGMDIAIYEVNNSGNLYDFGYCIGVGR